MRTRVFNLDCMTDGITSDGPDKSIQAQMKEVMDKRHGCEFVALIYHPSKTQNMVYASLIIKTKE